MTEQAGTAVAVIDNNQLPAGRTIRPGTPVAAFVPQDFAQAQRIALVIADSGMAPKSYSNDANKILVGMMTGAEVGLTPMQSLRGVAVIGNMPKLWGDVALGVVLSSGLVEDMVEATDGVFEPNGGNGVAICTIKRKGRPTPVIRRFSVDDARRAGLITKDTYKGYLERMCQRRARDRAMSDLFADVLAGLPVANIEDEEPTLREVTDRAIVETRTATVDDLQQQARGESTPLATKAAVEASGTMARTASDAMIEAEARRAAATAAPKRQRVRKPKDDVPNPPAPPITDDDGERFDPSSGESLDREPAQPEPEAEDAQIEEIVKREPTVKDHMELANAKELLRDYEKDVDKYREEGDTDALKFAESTCASIRAQIEKLEAEVDFSNPFDDGKGGYDISRDEPEPEKPTGTLEQALVQLRRIEFVMDARAFKPDFDLSPEDQMAFEVEKGKHVAGLVAAAKQRR